MSALRSVGHLILSVNSFIFRWNTLFSVFLTIAFITIFSIDWEPNRFQCEHNSCNARKTCAYCLLLSIWKHWNSCFSIWFCFWGINSGSESPNRSTSGLWVHLSAILWQNSALYCWLHCCLIVLALIRMTEYCYITTDGIEFNHLIGFNAIQCNLFRRLILMNAHCSHCPKLMAFGPP